MVWNRCVCYSRRSKFSGELHEPPYAERHVRWCERWEPLTGLPPTRSPGGACDLCFVGAHHVGAREFVFLGLSGVLGIAVGDSCHFTRYNAGCWRVY